MPRLMVGIIWFFIQQIPPLNQEHYTSVDIRAIVTN